MKRLLWLALALPLAAEVRFFEPGLSAGVAVPQIHTPTEMGRDSQGRLYVGNGGRDSFTRSRLHRVLADGTVEAFGPVILDPDAVVIDSQDRVYVGTRRDGIVRIRPAGTMEPFAGTRLVRDGQVASVLLNIDGMTMDAEERIYATGTLSRDLTRVDPDGTVTVLTRFSFTPKGVTFGCDGALYVAGGVTGLVMRYDLASGAVRQFSAGLPVPIGLVQDPATGDLIAACTPFGYTAGTGRLVRVHMDGDWTPLVDGLDSPYGLRFDAPGRLLVSDELGDRIWAITGFRAFAQEEVVTVREAGKPVLVSVPFHLCRNVEATLVATSGATGGRAGVSSAVVKLDGSVVIPASSFNPRVGEVRVSVRLDPGDHVLQVELRGSPGDVLRVRLE